MAFHVACPITCRRICYCSLGFPKKVQSSKSKDDFVNQVLKLEEFVKDPRLFLSSSDCNNNTVQVVVPKVVVTPSVPVVAVASSTIVIGGSGGGDGGGGDTAEELLSAQTKRAAMQKKAAVASMVAEDYARRFETGVVAVAKEVVGEEQGQSNVNGNVMCRLCYNGENEGSERARKMLSCKCCGKKYHRSCLKSWAQHRDLFHWSSWACPSCRICEVCRRTGDPNKLMFCKRCDGAYHCYCQQPPHKNVSSGPYLCPKHTKCHSCGSSVPGNGLSLRWFLGYTCCDACGRLFVKGNYCPVCLKVYRDSESTPMVCCDVCQRWVHCHCDGISDEKYMQFQVDGNLQYKCATCRGECYQVRNLEDAVQELWRRKDEAERDLTASLRAAAGLPTQEEIFSISPYSDDEDSGPVGLKNEYGRSLKFSLKGLVDKSPKKSKEYGKKSSNKKFSKKKIFNKMEPPGILEGHSDAQSIAYVSGDKDNNMHSHRSNKLSYPIAGSLTDGVCSINQAGSLKHRFIDEVTAKANNSAPRTLQTKSYKSQGLFGEDIHKDGSKSKTTKGPKLVIHLSSRNKNVTDSPRSDASNYQRDQELTTSNGSDDLGQQGNDRHMTTSKLFETKVEEKSDWYDQTKGSKLRGKDSNLIKIRKLNSEGPDMNPIRSGGTRGYAYQSPSQGKSRVLFGKGSNEGSATAVGKHAEGRDGDSRAPPSASHSSQKDSKPSLKLKFKNPFSDNQTSWVPSGEDDLSSVKGQRSKRRRSAAFMEKTTAKDEEEASQSYDDKRMNEIMDANWIIQRLGKDAIGKKVEVHQLSNNSWHKGTVTEVFAGTSIVSVALDDGNSKNVDLDKQGIRFVSQKKQRR